MRNWSLEHVGNAVLLRDLQALAVQDHLHLAKLLAHIGEVQARKLYRDAAQPDMRSYCVNVLHFSEDAAWKRMYVAGVTRKIPALLEAIAEGRLHLSGACEIAAHLTPENAEQVLAAVTHKTREQIKVVVAALAPRPDLEERVTPLRVASSEPLDPVVAARSAQVVGNMDAPPAPGQVETVRAADSEASSGPESAVIRVHQTAPAPATHAAAPSRVTPRAPGRYGVQLNIDEATNDLLEKVKNLFGHRGKDQLEKIFGRALELLVRDLERRKCGKSDKPRKAKRPKTPHVISAGVRQEVWERDQGQCTFVNEEGRRCPSRGGLEIDHIDPKARAAMKGRTTTVTASDLRLLCGEHNQLVAERVYGAAFMRHKRESAMTMRSAAT